MSLTEVQKLNREEMSSHWFSTPQKTKEAAEALHQPGMFEFDPAAVYRREPEGDFMMGLLKGSIKHWPPHEQANLINEWLGYVMVSCCDPLMGIWKEYQPEPVAVE